jgi:hypothetical protein
MLQIEILYAVFIYHVYVENIPNILCRVGLFDKIKKEPIPHLPYGTHYSKYRNIHDWGFDEKCHMSTNYLYYYLTH